MAFFWHNFYPQPVLFSLGPINVYWYGLFMILAIMAGLGFTLRLARKYGLKSENVFDLAFWLIIGGLIGARIYDVFLNLPYYAVRPSDVIKIWQGGLAIHGAIIAGLIVLKIFASRLKIGFGKLAALIVPGLALGQTIGRWGNYFNQELFGQPTNLSWGIPISPFNRPAAYADYRFFHPTFLYESILCFLIFLFLAAINARAIKKNRLNNRFFIWSTASYVILYSIVRFLLEFIKIDATPLVFGLRWPQIVSLLLIISSLLILIFNPHARRQKIS
jgi:phosphatidylglycerol:prolipoprotein diacylglycerol transferase